MSVRRVFPAVARNAEGAANAAGGQHHRFASEQPKPTAFTIIAERADDAALALQERGDRGFHVDVDAEVDRVILERANHLEPGAVANVGEPRIPVSAKVALQNPPIVRAVEHRAPRFQFANTIGRLLRVQLRHPSVVHVLTAAHGVCEVHLPVVTIIHVTHRRRGAALRHHGVRLAEQRLAHESDAHTGCGRLNRCTQARPAGANDEDVVFVRLIVRN